MSVVIELLTMPGDLDWDCFGIWCAIKERRQGMRGSIDGIGMAAGAVRLSLQALCVAKVAASALEFMRAEPPQIACHAHLSPLNRLIVGRSAIHQFDSCSHGLVHNASLR
jgi:hypothetical protein